MGTLGQYLRSARETRGIELHDAAQQTRIGINFLKALEEEDFSRLPGEVFVKGFLKNYGRFLRLEESELMKRYGELKPPKSALDAVTGKERVAADSEQKLPQQAALEPFLWGAGIAIAFILFLFTALPGRRSPETHKAVTPMSTNQTVTTPVPITQPGKLYLEVVALENTWILVRTDNSPQKKALLKTGERLTWSADERFLLSYGSVGALKLTLNGRELIVKEPGNAVVRDLAVIASGIVNRNIQAQSARPARPKKGTAEGQQQPPPVREQQPSPAQMRVREHQSLPSETPIREQQPPAAAPKEQPASPAPVPSLQTRPDEPQPKPQPQ